MAWKTTKQIDTVTVTNTETIYRNLGFTESVTSCDCCGRVDLKGTYAIENLQSGDIMYLGCVCAAHRMNWSKRQFVDHYKAEVLAQSKAARKEYRQSAGYMAYNAWGDSLNTRFPSHSDEDHAGRMNAIHTEREAIYALRDASKKEIAIKYPLAGPVYY